MLLAATGCTAPAATLVSTVVRVCIVYDCLYPYTIGGAERWYRNLAEGLAAAGHEVTYVTLRQWHEGETGEVPGVHVVEAGPCQPLYVSGRRRILPTLVFGWHVLRHLARRGRDYDVVYTGSFPYFPLIAAALVRRRGGYRLAVDWIEVWSLGYWREYLGVTGPVGWLVQRLCIRIPQESFCLSQLHAARLREQGASGRITVLRGLRGGSDASTETPAPAQDVIVFAGRHIPEKRVAAVAPAVAAARREIPGLRGEIFGDGPDREALLAQLAALGVEAFVDAPGFVDQERIERSVARALCLVLPSRREGYGLIVVEAASVGTPSIVVVGPDNAATELIEEGVNGFISETAAPEDIASAVVRVHAGGPALRASTLHWYREHADELSVAASVRTVVEVLDRLAR